MTEVVLETTINKNVVCIIVIARAIIVIQRPYSMIVGKQKVVGDVSKVSFIGRTGHTKSQVS